MPKQNIGHTEEGATFEPLGGEIREQPFAPESKLAALGSAAHFLPTYLDPKSM